MNRYRAEKIREVKALIRMVRYYGPTHPKSAELKKEIAVLKYQYQL